MSKTVFSRYFAYIRGLPLGCKYCMKGVKMVIFATGLCDENCFYCPVSRQKLYRDVIWVDEEQARSINDVILEAFRIGAEGAGITGGDPLRVPSRVIKIIKSLKKIFGDSFHIHLYTSGRYALPNLLLRLEEAGLDEIRFHPVEEWMLSRIIMAKKLLKKTRVGVEIPVIPGREEEIKRLILWLDSQEIEFINLNELEASAANIESLAKRGFIIDKEKYVVNGSEDAALSIVEWALKNTKRVQVHYCPARYKDSIQLRLRLVRKSLRIRACNEEVTPQGLVKTRVAPQKLVGKHRLDQCYSNISEQYVALPPSTNTGCLVEVYPYVERHRILGKLASTACEGLEH